MTQRAKAIWILGGAFLLLVAALSWVARTALLERFARLEEQDARQNVERAMSALSDELAQVAAQTEDYASWDETYRFMERRDEKFTLEDFPTAAHAAIRVHVIVVLDTSGGVVFGRSLDLERRRDGPVPPSLDEPLRSLRLRERRGKPGVQGILILPEGVLLVATRPILTSEGEGPPRGTLVMGRYLDDWEMEKLTRYTRFILSLNRFDDPKAAPDVQWARGALSDRSPILTRRRGDDVVSGYALLEDVHEKPALILRVDSYRRIYKEGQTSVETLTVAFALLGLACGVVSLVVLEGFCPLAPASSPGASG